LRETAVRGGKQKQALTFAAKQQRQNVHSGFIFEAKIRPVSGWGLQGHLTKGEEIMRRYRLSICLAVVGLAMSLGYSTSQAQGLPGACAVGLNIHPGAWILLHRHPIARCTSNGGCKCVSCYNFNGSVSAVCYPLIAPIPGPGR
jgi:hypothetical protein